MTLREALRKVDRQKVFDIIHARDSKNAAACDRPAWLQVTSSYTKVIEELLGKPKARKYSMSIVVKYNTDPFDKHRYVDVALLNPRYVAPPKGFKPWGGSKNLPPKHYNCNLNKHNKYFSLMGVRWSKLIDTPIVFEAKITLEKALAAFLWELTFDGWTEEKAAAHTEFVMERCKEAVKEIKEGKCVELPPKKKGKFKIVIPDCVSKQIVDIVNKEAKPIEKKCKTCYGYGLWGIGQACPMGPMDASDGLPTKPCPECGANANP